MKNFQVIGSAILLVSLLALSGCPDAAKQGGSGAAQSAEPREKDAD